MIVPKAVLFFSNQVGPREDVKVLQRLLLDAVSQTARDVGQEAWKVFPAGAIPKGTATRSASADILVETGQDDASQGSQCAKDAERIARRVRHKLQDMFPGVTYMSSRRLKRFTFPFPGGKSLMADIMFEPQRDCKVVVDGTELSCKDKPEACQAIKLLQEMEDTNRSLEKLGSWVIEALVLQAMHEALRSGHATHPWIIVLRTLHHNTVNKTLTKLATDLSLYLPPGLPVSVDPRQLLSWGEASITVLHALTHKTFDNQKHVMYLLSGQTQCLAERPTRAGRAASGSEYLLGGAGNSAPIGRCAASAPTSREITKVADTAAAAAAAAAAASCINSNGSSVVAGCGRDSVQSRSSRSIQLPHNHAVGGMSTTPTGSGPNAISAPMPSPLMSSSGGLPRYKRQVSGPAGSVDGSATTATATDDCLSSDMRPYRVPSELAPDLRLLMLSNQSNGSNHQYSTNHTSNPNPSQQTTNPNYLYTHNNSPGIASQSCGSSKEGVSGKDTSAHQRGSRWFSATGATRGASSGTCTTLTSSGSPATSGRHAESAQTAAAAAARGKGGRTGGGGGGGGFFAMCFGGGSSGQPLDG